jgi:hypothetical protein
VVERGTGPTGSPCSAAESALVTADSCLGALAFDSTNRYLARAMPFDREAIKHRAAELAAKGVFIGTSSWKYEGWFGQLYTPGQYEYRGKVAKTRFQRGCLNEYAEVFKTVCVDAAYYDFARREYLQGLADQVPDDFRFGFKVTDALTIKRFSESRPLRIARWRSKREFSKCRFIRDRLSQAMRRHPRQGGRVDVRVLALLSD